MGQRSINKSYIYAFSVFLSLLYLLSLSCDEGSGSEPGQESAAVIVEKSRDTNETNDFLRITFLPSNVVPTQVGRPSALRVFVGATAFYEPPVSVEKTAAFFGIPIGQSQKGLDLVAFRCIPGEPEKLEPSLATWPNVFERVVEDLGGQYTCPPESSSPENELLCLAEGYEDTPSEIVTENLANAIGLGAVVMTDPDLAGVLGNIYGISSAFGGIGLAVNGASGNALTAEEALVRSVVPEYIVKNSTLTEAGCFCIRVPPYEGREGDPLDPDFIMKKGGFGECNIVNKLGL
ncbi:MAG TPA: hypothetical protein VHC46_10360 [Thermodesulfobacteriota bacterium]|nr:hypothetical protein [Thermodesulfobacteriota bacterium]